MSHWSVNMADSNQGCAKLPGCRSTASPTLLDMPRVVHQNPYRPLRLRNLEEASRSRPRPKKEKGHYRTNSGSDVMWKCIDEFMLQGKPKSSKPITGNDTSRPYARRPSHNSIRHSSRSHQSYCGTSTTSHRSQEQRRRQAKGDKPEYEAQSYTVWGDLKNLIRSNWYNHAERKTTLAKQPEREDRKAAKARAEKAAVTTPIYGSMRTHSSVRQFQRGSCDSVKKPQSAVTRKKVGATPGTYPSDDKKPVMAYQKGLRTVAKHAVQVRGLPRTHASVHIIKQMPSNGSAVRSTRLSPDSPDHKQSRLTRLGDFMEELAFPRAPSPPPKDTPRQQTPNTKPVQRSLNPLQCDVCGAEPAPGLAFSATNLWLCSGCLDPHSPFEAPPEAKEGSMSGLQHATSSSKHPTVNHWTLSRSRSPLSMISRSRSRSRRLSEDEALDIGDVEIIPLSDWHRHSNDVHPGLRQPPTPAHRPNMVPPSKEDPSVWRDSRLSSPHPAKPLFISAGNPCPQDKQRQPSLPPTTAGVSPRPPLRAKPRAASSIYPDDLVPIVPDVPLPPIPASLKNATREDKKDSFYPLPPAPSRSPSPKLTNAKYKKPTVEGVEGGERDVEKLRVRETSPMNRRSSFYGFYAPILRELGSSEG
ncbi:MAG: hypothetical protein Q9217_003653 [Psora testacea]